jgi:BirA family biotin operon repressor/biotin-[acetyl-CoA-carboxylase] ligase
MKFSYYHFEKTDSTQAFAKNNLTTFPHDRVVIITADEQTQGQGRLGRSWHGPKGNLLLSIVLFNETFSPFFLTQLAALALCDLIASFKLKATLKWPNDLQVEGKKIAGILATVSQEAIILGIGLNINMCQEELALITTKEATSLAVLKERSFEVENIRDQLLERLFEYHEKAKKKGVEQFQKKWQKKLHWMKGNTILASTTKEVAEVCIEDIRLDGTLEVVGADGKKRLIYSADICDLSQAS